MDNFTEIVQRFSPAAWFDRGLTWRDEAEPSKPPRWYADTSVVRRGVIGVAAAGAVAASTVLGSPSLMASSNVAAAAKVFGANQQSEVPPGYWPRMITKVRSLPRIEEDRFVDMESVI